MVDTSIDEPTDADLDERPAAGDEVAAPPPTLSTRLAFWVFVAYVVVSFFVILLVLGDERWFLGDEWTFLAGRETGELGDYFQPVNGHWVVVPNLLWRVLFEIFGLHTYRPYEILVIATHLTSACLLRAVMRRVGVNPWIATAAAGVFVLFGAGESNIVWGFQITLGGSLAAGIGHMLLADHDGGIDRRDWIGLGVGLIGLTSSGVGVVMVAAVGLAVLLRRGWKLALFHTAPLAVVYAAWWLVHRPSTVLYPDGLPAGDAAEAARRYGWLAVTGTFDAIGQNPVIAIILATMLVVGLLMAWLPLDRPTFGRRAGMPLALLLGAVALVATTLLSRAWALGPNEARADRYLHLFAALTLPALAVAGDALARRWRPLVPVVVVLFLAGIPGNIDEFERSVYGEQYFASQRHLTLNVARHERADEAPDWVTPEPQLAPDRTMGWLRQTIAEGKMPDAEPTTDVDATFPVRFGVAFEREDVPEGLKCKPLERPTVRTPPVGKRWGAPDGMLVFTLLDDGVPVSRPVRIDPQWAGRSITVTIPDLELRVSSADPDDPSVFCW